MGKIKLNTGDEGITLTFNIKDKDGVAVNLTTCNEARLQWAKPNDTALLVDVEATVTDAAAGEVQYTTTSVEHATAGEFEAKIKCTFSGGRTIKARLPNVIVAGDFPTG